MSREMLPERGPTARMLTTHELRRLGWEVEGADWRHRTHAPEGVCVDQAIYLQLRAITELVPGPWVRPG